MAANSEDALYLEARAVYGQEFDSWAANLLQILQSKDRGNNCLSYLRQCLVLTSVTKYNRNMTSQVYRCLRSIVLEPEQGPVKIRLVAAAILRELSPLQKILIRDFSPPIDPQNIPYILPVVIAQSNVKEQSVILITHLTKWLTHPGIEENLCISSLSALSTLLSHSSFIESFTEEQLDLLNSKFSHWLKHASKNSLSQSSSGISLFTGASRKQVVPIQEIDGSTAQDIFTILSIGDQYFCDQLLNIRMFSMLRRWIGSTKALGCSAPSPHDTPTPTPDSSSHTSSSDHRSLTVSMISNATPTSLTSASPSSFVQSYRPEAVGGAMGGAMGGIVNTALQYCLRVINQCERKPLKNNNDELIKACLYEAVTLLDIICGSKHRAIHEVFSTVKSLFSRILHDENYSRVSLAVVKFFINHGKSEMYSYEPGIHALFGDVLSNKFNDPGIAFDAVEFCLSNLEQLCYSTTIFTKYFPNLLKILAWSPPTYISEYLQLLPAFINEQTASEVLHSILDLPCLSAVLTANYLVANVQPSVLQNMLPQYLECLTALQDQSNKLLFGHFLRNESGRGDTIDKLKYLHEILEDFNKHQRIINASEIVPLLLKIYFKIVINFGNKELLSELINVLLERVLCLYNEATFQEEVRQVMAEKLVDIFQTHPSLLIEKFQEVKEFFNNYRILKTSNGEFYIHLVWIVGEFAHTGYDVRCTADKLSLFYETLEMIGYEISYNLGQYSGYTLRLIMVLMNTLAKLASRCQDLIPRTLLCLNKIVNQSIQNVPQLTDRKLMYTRMNELSNILKMPSVASAVLTPVPNCCDPHQISHQMNIATIMQSTTHLITGNNPIIS